MDLRHNQITVGEILDYPPAKAVIVRRFPMLLRHPMLGAARTVTLEQLLAFGQAYLPKCAVNDALKELSAV